MNGLRGAVRPVHRGHRQTGQGLVEYGLILVIVAVACVASLVFFGDQLASILSLIASHV